jgi:hypothetical protein
VTRRRKPSPTAKAGRKPKPIEVAAVGIAAGTGHAQARGAAEAVARGNAVRSGHAVGHAPKPKPPRRKRTAKKYDVVLAILADIDQSEGLPSDLTPAEIEKKVLFKMPPELRRRWEKRGPDGNLITKAVSRKVINGAYQDYLKTRSSK